jgi:hypothetical protein
MRKIILTSTLFCLLVSINVDAQCVNWENLPNKDEVLQSHSIYRQEIKIKNYDMAFEHWEKAYSSAPAADGKRDYHYIDGITLYKEKLKKATADEKANIKARILSLYEEAIACYESKSIKLKCSENACYNKKMGYLLGRKGFDMYYDLNSPYSKNMVVFEKAVELAGIDSEYIVFAPYGNIAIYEFEKGNITKEQARNIYERLNKIAEHNITNNKKYGAYYKQAIESMNAAYTKIERDIFDCDFFKEKLRPEYEEAPDDPDVIKRVIAILKGQGCEPGDPFFDELDAKWKAYASKENARLLAEDEQSNPAKYAKRLRQEGDYKGAIEKYKEAIEIETDNIKLASYYHSIAQIQYGEYKKYDSARSNARKAAELRPGWGKPFITIGDMYARTARSCGDAWNQRLAILAAIDKYNYARSIDVESSETAIERASKYRSSMPSQDEGFMRGIKSGQTVKVGCWIGESVKVRYN